LGNGLVKEWYERCPLALGGKIGSAKIADHHQTCLFGNNRRRIKLQANTKLGSMKDGLTVNTYGLNRAKAVGVFFDNMHELADLVCKRQAGLLGFKQCGLAKRVVQLQEGLSKPLGHWPAPEPKPTGPSPFNPYQYSIKSVQTGSGHDAKKKLAAPVWRCRRRPRQVIALQALGWDWSFDPR
jgi:hypothetical protein